MITREEHEAFDAYAAPYLARCVEGLKSKEEEYNKRIRQLMSEQRELGQLIEFNVKRRATIEDMLAIVTAKPIEITVEMKRMVEGAVA